MNIPSFRKLTYPSVGKGTSSSRLTVSEGNMLVPRMVYLYNLPKYWKLFPPQKTSWTTLRYREDTNLACISKALHFFSTAAFFTWRQKIKKQVSKADTDLPEPQLEGERGPMSFRTGRWCETKFAYTNIILMIYMKVGRLIGMDIVGIAEKRLQKLRQSINNSSVSAWNAFGNTSTPHLGNYAWKQTDTCCHDPTMPDRLYPSGPRWRWT